MDADTLLDTAARSPISGNDAPLLIPDTAAAALAGVSRSHWHALRAGGKLPPPIKLGRAVRWRRDEIIAWIEAGCPDGRIWEAMKASAGRRMKAC